MTAALEPLRFRRHLVEKPWGGRALEARFGFELPPGAPIGETWEVVDREGENSIVAEGAFAGTSLRELMERHGKELLGHAAPARGGRFPLLVKYIDAADDLSVQVHPDERSAERLGGGAEPKTEAWYVVGAAEGARLYVGLRPGVTRDELERVASEAGVVERLRAWPVEPGDAVLVGGGTVHAIGAGVSILEVQQNSDTTYRLYDWGRVGLDGHPRETHVAEALVCARLEGDPPLVRAGDRGERTLLAESHAFRMEELCPAGRLEADTAGGFVLLAVVEGSGTLETRDAGSPRALSAGDVWLLPASLGYHAVSPAAGGLRLVRATPPAP